MRKGLLLKFSLLSASLLVASAPAINANIPAMAEAFPTIPLSMVEMLTTIPSMFLMLSVLISSFIAKKIGYKQTISLGLMIVAISGIIPIFIDNFYIILLSRACLGFGIGLFNSLLVSMISYFYDGDERSSIIGLQSACEGLGGMGITFIAGQLLRISWQCSFYAYFMAVPVVVLFVLFVPKVKTEDMHITPKENIESENVKKTNKTSYILVLGYTCLMFFISVLYMIMGIKVSTLMTSEGYATASEASIVIICLSLGSMLSGVIFGQIFKVLKQYIMSLGLAILGISMFLIGTAESLYLVMISGFLIGVGFRMVFPYLINKVSSIKVSNSSLATSLFLAGSNLGTFVAPYGAIVLQNIAGGKNLRGLFYIDGTCFLILSVISVIMFILRRGAKKKTLLLVE